MGYVYILSNYKRTSLYIDVTNDVERRVLEHKLGIGSKHTTRYNLKYLMYYEKLPSITKAIEREKQLKNWHREWKWNLIKEQNPQLADLAADWFTDADLNQTS